MRENKEDIIKYACDLEDKICNLNAEITELQQENERLKEWKEDLLKENIELENIKKEAIEYINHAQNYGTMAQVMPHLKPYVNGDDLLNILQNESEDNE